MVVDHSCSAPGPWSGSTGEMISCGAEVCVYLWGEPPFTCLAGREPGSYCLYSQSRSNLYCTLHRCRYSCYSFCLSLPSHSVTVCTYAHSLTLARPLTPYHKHLTHCPIPERGYATLTTMATADVGDPSTFWISSELC